nr:MAG TPA: hypothetical protein [Bacteriophage sp.]
MTSSIFIPKTINVGYQNRNDTYTGKLAYVIYYDEKGKLRKETSWNSWRNKDIPNDEFENIPTEGFVLNKKAGDYSTGWDHRHAYCRVYDPRGFEFEISIENLLYILENTTCIPGKGLQGEFVYGWDGTNLVLMPIVAPDYKQIAAYNKIVHNNESIKTRDLLLGATYLTKENTEWIYMGRFETYEYGYEFVQDGKIMRTKRYSDLPTEKSYMRRKVIPYKDINNLPYGKMHWFARLSNDKYVFEQFKNVPKNKLIGCVDDKCTSKYSEIYDEMESSYQFSPIDDSKDRIINTPFEDFYAKAVNTYVYDDRTRKYVDVQFMSNANEKYTKYEMRTPYRSEDNGKYTVYKYNNINYYNGDKEVIDIFPTQEEEVTDSYGIKRIETHMIPVSIETVFEKLKPVCKQKYLANGREYKKEFLFNE